MPRIIDRIDNLNLISADNLVSLYNSDVMHTNASVFNISDNIFAITLNSDRYDPDLRLRSAIYDDAVPVLGSYHGTLYRPEFKSDPDKINHDSGYVIVPVGWIKNRNISYLQFSAIIKQSYTGFNFSNNTLKKPYYHKTIQLLHAKPAIDNKHSATLTFTSEINPVVNMYIPMSEKQTKKVNQWLDNYSHVLIQVTDLNSVKKYTGQDVLKTYLTDYIISARHFCKLMQDIIIYSAFKSEKDKNKENKNVLNDQQLLLYQNYVIQTISSYFDILLTLESEMESSWNNKLQHQENLLSRYTFEKQYKTDIKDRKKFAKTMKDSISSIRSDFKSEKEFDEWIGKHKIMQAMFKYSNRFNVL